MDSESLLSPSYLVKIIPVLYAISICIAVMNLLGYYQYFNATWILKELSTSYILINSAGFFFAIASGCFLGYQVYRIRIINKKCFNIKDFFINLIITISFILLLNLILFYLNRIHSEIIVFSSLYAFGYISSYAYLRFHDKNYINNFRSELKIIVILFISVSLLTSGYCHAMLKFYLDEFYTVNLEKNSEKFYLLETIGDKAFIFKLESSPPEKMKYKIVRTDNIELIYKK